MIAQDSEAALRLAVAGGPLPRFGESIAAAPASRRVAG
jgi:hypothetical protein